MKRTLTPHDRILQAAREMRRNATPAEKVLWAELRDRRLAGLKFYRQDVIGPFIADFYCASARLVVEVDGDIHVAAAALSPSPSPNSGGGVKASHISSLSDYGRGGSPPLQKLGEGDRG